MAERKFISDEEFERQIDEIAETVRQAQWEETKEIWEKRFAEMCQRHAAEAEAYRHRIDHTRGQKKLRNADVKTPYNDKWEHGEIFYPHPVWWQNEEIIKSLEE